MRSQFSVELLVVVVAVVANQIVIVVQIDLIRIQFVEVEQNLFAVAGHIL